MLTLFGEGIKWNIMLEYDGYARVWSIKALALLTAPGTKETLKKRLLV